MGVYQVYCSICGAPMKDLANSRHQEWLARCLLLTTAHKTSPETEELDLYHPQTSMLPTYFYHLGQNPPAESSRVVLSLEANIDCFSYEFQLQSGEVVNAIQVRCTRNVGGHLYIPIHEACLHIAHRFIERATDKDQKEGPVVNGIDSIRSLWEVLYRRVDGSSNPIYVGYLPEPHDYYGGKLCRGLDWELPNDPEDGDLLEQNPLEQLPNFNSPTNDEIFDILESTNPTPYDELPSIRNGKRIWRILSEARIGDVAEVEIARREACRAEIQRKRAEDKEQGLNTAIPMMPPMLGMPPGFERFTPRK